MNLKREVVLNKKYLIYIILALIAIYLPVYLLYRDIKEDLVIVEGSQYYIMQKLYPESTSSSKITP